MGAEENRELGRRWLTGTGENDFDAALSDDVVWRIGGGTVFSDTFNGKADVYARLLGPLQSRLSSGGSMTIQAITADEDRVVVQGDVSGRVTTDGKPYDNHYCFVCVVRDGKIVEVDEYCDTELITTAFGPRP
jgi:ketosteroid isomerase-like protein